MKSKAVALGHPIHPMLIPFPFAFLTGAVLFDAAGSFGNVPSWWTTGSHLSLAGIVTAILAASPVSSTISTPCHQTVPGRPERPNICSQI